ncbi:MAG: lipid-binding SYLF domain-containing protein [Woeseiaceae bacterium]
MKNLLRTPSPMLLAIAILFLTVPMAYGQSKEDERIVAAGAIIDELRAIPEKAIPPALLDRAYAVAVIPDMLKIGVGLAGRHGKGVLTVRNPEGWSAPAFIKLSGGSIGWQAGLQSSDLVLVFTNERGLKNITSGKLTLGADLSIAAGPVGRHGSAATDGRFRAEVYSYSRARGLFAGVSVEGAVLRIDNNANAAYYAEPAVNADAIINGQLRSIPDGAIQFTRRFPHGDGTSFATASTSQSAEERFDEMPLPESDVDTEVKTYGIGERNATD